MQTENKDDLIDFEDLFEEKTPEPNHNQNMSVLRALSTVLIYFFIMLFVAAFIVLGFYEVKSFTHDYSIEESMLYNVDQDTYGLGYLRKADFEALSGDYFNIIVLYEDNSYVIFANENNEYLKDTYTVDMIRVFYLNQDITWNDDIISQKVTIYMFGTDAAFMDHFNIFVILNEENLKVPTTFTEITSSASAILNFVVYIILAVSILPVTLNTLKVEVTYFKKPLKDIGVDAVLGYVYMMIASIAAQAIITVIGFIFDYTQPVSLNQQAIERSLLSSTGILMILMTVIFAPVLEELVFRKAMFRFFKNPWVAMVISSVLFGLIHVTSETEILAFVTNLITYSASGFALGYVYIKNKNNVWASILVHAVSNAVSIIFILVGALL